MDFPSYLAKINKEAAFPWAAAAAVMTGSLLGMKVAEIIYFPGIVVDLATFADIVIITRLVQYVVTPFFEGTLPYPKLMESLQIAVPIWSALILTAPMQRRSGMHMVLFGVSVGVGFSEYLRPFLTLLKSDQASS